MGIDVRNQKPDVLRLDGPFCRDSQNVPQVFACNSKMTTRTRGAHLKAVMAAKPKDVLVLPVVSRIGFHATEEFSFLRHKLGISDDRSYSRKFSRRYVSRGLVSRKYHNPISKTCCRAISAEGAARAPTRPHAAALWPAAGTPLKPSNDTATTNRPGPPVAAPPRASSLARLAPRHAVGRDLSRRPPGWRDQSRPAITEKRRNAIHRTHPSGNPANPLI